MPLCVTAALSCSRWAARGRTQEREPFPWPEKALAVDPSFLPGPIQCLNPPRGETVTDVLLNKRLLAAVTCQAPYCEEAWHFLSSGSPVTDRGRHVCCLSSVSLCYLPVSPSHHPVPGWRWEPFPFLGRWVTTCTGFPASLGCIFQLPAMIGQRSLHLWSYCQVSQATAS